MPLEHGREPGVDRLRERQQLVAREPDRVGGRGDRRRRSRRERRHHLVGRAHLRQRGRLERLRPDAVACGRVLVCELLARAPSGGDEPARGAEQRVALVVLADRARRPVGDLGVGAGVAQVADGAEMEHRRPALLADPAGELAGDLEHRRGIAAVGLLVADRGA